MPVDPSTVDHEIRTPVDGFTKAVRDKNIDARCRPTSSDNARPLRLARTLLLRQLRHNGDRSKE